MCCRIAKKETNKRKTIIAYKIFRSVNKVTGAAGLFPTFWCKVRTKSAVVGKWLRSSRIGWHAYLTCKDARNNCGCDGMVFKVRLRCIIGYGYSYVSGPYTVRALEMKVLPVCLHNVHLVTPAVMKAAGIKKLRKR